MAQVTVKSKFGNMQAIDEADLPKALSHGFSLASNDEIQSHNDQLEHGSGILNPLIAGAEEAASTATFGASRELENATGLTTPEAQAARAKYNPTANTIGAVGGLFTDPLGAIGGVNKLGGQVAEGASKVIGKAPEGAGFIAKAARNMPAAALGAGLEGAAFGAGQSVAEHAMGDPDALGEHLMASVGYGSLFAGGLGAALEGGSNAFGKSFMKDGAQAASYKNDITNGIAAGDAAKAEEAVLGPQVLSPESPAALPKEYPKSLAEMKQIVDERGPMVPDRPSSDALREIFDPATTVLGDIEMKPHNLQMEALKDGGTWDFYKTLEEGQSEESKVLRDYSAGQKAEAEYKLEKTFNDLASDQKIISEPTQGGEHAIDAFSKQYDAEKKALTPLFKQFDELAEGKKIGGFNSLVGLHDTFPDIGRWLNADKEGVFKLSKYAPDMPFSKNTYGAIRDLVTAANSGDLTLSGLRNIRESMRDRLTLAAGPRDTHQIGSIRKMLMDHMQESIDKLAPDLNVRETFKRYAQNEERRGIIEKILGGSISDKASFAKSIKPEDVLNKIFSNTVSVDAAKQILGKDFDHILANWLAQNKERVSDQVKNGFSSNKYATFLRGKNPELLTALAENPKVLKRIGDLTDYMRILPDSPSVNPSGTAKTLGIMEKMAGLSRALKPTNMLEDFATRFAEKAQAEKQRFTLEEVLAGRHLGAAKEAADANHLATSRLAKIERFAEDTAYRMQANAKALFGAGLAAAKKSVGLIGAKLAPKSSKKEDKVKDSFAKIMNLQTNPEAMMDELEKATASIFPHAPGISQGVQAAATRATEFLASKIPPMPPASPFTKAAYEPSQTEVAQFERYFHAVEDPVGVMADIKTGNIAPESVEALGTVYPKLYSQMKLAIMDEASKAIGRKKEIPYHIRQSISSFLGEPLEASLLPQSVMANQQAFLPKGPGPNQPKPSKGGMAKIDMAKRFGLNRGEMET